MGTRLMTVEETVEVSGGLIVLPLPKTSTLRGDLNVEIRRPDGSTLRATLNVARWELTLEGLTQGDVPPGSEIWG